MDIREALLAEHSNRQTMLIVHHIDGDPVKFRELMSLFLGDNYRTSQRAEMVLGGKRKGRQL